MASEYFRPSVIQLTHKKKGKDEKEVANGGHGLTAVKTKIYKCEKEDC